MIPFCALASYVWLRFPRFCCFPPSRAPTDTLHSPTNTLSHPPTLRKLNSKIMFNFKDIKIQKCHHRTHSNEDHAKVRLLNRKSSSVLHSAKFYCLLHVESSDPHTVKQSPWKSQVSAKIVAWSLERLPHRHICNTT